MVKILIGNSNSKIVGFIPQDIQDKLDKALSYMSPGAKYSKKYKSGQWDGRIRFYYKNRGQSFLTGMLSIVSEILQANNIAFKKIDRRSVPEQNLPFLEFEGPKGFQEREYQSFTVENAIKRTRGILKIATGGGKCLGKGTPVLMFDGTTRYVEDIKVGDILMGPDSTPRHVRSTTVGHGPLYRVKQINGDDYVCNDAHILCLQRTGCPSRGWKAGEEVKITAEEFYNSHKFFKHTHKGYKVGVCYPEKNVPLDPYFVGLWLGDGNSRAPMVTTGDIEVEDYLKSYASKNGLQTSEQEGCGCKNISLVGYKKGQKREGPRKNIVRDALNTLNLILNKHIPQCYLINSRDNRLKLLAGLIDSDGSVAKPGAVEIESVNQSLAQGICHLARSLGFRSSINKRKTSLKSRNYNGVAWRVRVSGKLSEVPVLIPRKKAGDQTKYSALRYGIELEPIGDGDYYGFEIDGDRKFLLGDFTVTHNTMVVSRIIGGIKTSPFMYYVLTRDLLDQAYDTLSSTLNVPIGRIGAGHFDIQEINVCTVQSVIRSIKDDDSFKISDYMFDNEEVWDEDDILSYEKNEAIKRLLGSAKGIYLDEAHHASSKMCVDIMAASPNAYWRFGGTATPYREDNAEIVLQGLFGKKIVDIDASYLIKRKYLLKPYILFNKIDHEDVPNTYASVYSQCVTKNQEFHEQVAKTANHLISRGLSTLILVQHYAHGEALQKMIPDAPFVTGKMSGNKRKECIQNLRDKKIMCMIATTLADEGLDIPTLDAALLAGGGASSTRVNQRVGRTLRPDRASKDPRDRSIVVVYDHKARFLDRQTRKIKKILKLEKEFNIIDSSGGDIILDEIDDIMGFEKKEDFKLF
jgi:superfamily II DNA or RNA helicase